MVLCSVTTTPLICGDHASLTTRILSARATRVAVAYAGGVLVAESGDSGLHRQAPAATGSGAATCVRRQRGTPGARLVPAQHGHRAVVRLDQRGQALDPVARVAVQHVADQPDLRVMDVAADDAVEAARARLARQRVLECADVRDRILDAQLEEPRQRPVGKAHARAQRVEVLVELERQRVETVPEQRQPLRARHDRVEAVAVRDEEARAGARDVHRLVADGDAAEVDADVVSRRLVVVARDVDDPRALARLAQHLLHDVVVRLRASTTGVAAASRR